MENMEKTTISNIKGEAVAEIPNPDMSKLEKETLRDKIKGMSKDDISYILKFVDPILLIEALNSYVQGAVALQDSISAIYDISNRLSNGGEQHIAQNTQIYGITHVEFDPSISPMTNVYYGVKDASCSTSATAVNSGRSPLLKLDN